MKIGSDVLYVLKSGPRKGELRPAIVTRIWNEMQDYPTEQKDADGKPIWGVRPVNKVDLAYFTAASDGVGQPVMWASDVPVNKFQQGEGYAPGSCICEEPAEPAKPEEPSEAVPSAETSVPPTAAPAETTPDAPAPEVEAPKAAKAPKAKK